MRCSVIGLAAELHVCKRMATCTGGDNIVVMDDKHYKETLTSHIDPPPAATRMDAALVKMGFPHHKLTLSETNKPVSETNDDSNIAVCMW